MKFTKEPPYSMGELVCLINATIDVLNLKANKLNKPSASEINMVLNSIGYGYKPVFDLKSQWIQFMDLIERMGIDAHTKEMILKKASYEFSSLSK